MTSNVPELMLLRHGIAEDRSNDLPDHDRQLTSAGRQRTRAVLERASALGIRVDRLVSSPLARARQTAAIAVECGIAPAMEISEALAPGVDPMPWLTAWLSEAPSSLMLVGHEPDLGLLASRLIAAPAGGIRFRKAGLARIELISPETIRTGNPGGGCLTLLLTPRALLR